MGIERYRVRLARWLIPHGWAVVPVEPTSKMTRAAAGAMSPGKRPTEEWVSCNEKHRIRWRAMVDEAPK